MAVVDVVVLRRCELGRHLVVDVQPFGAQCVEDIGEVAGGPQHAGVGDQCQAEDLVDLIVKVASACASLVSEERVAA